MDKNIGLRISMDAVMVVCIIFGWWYIALPIGVIGLFRFSYYVELIAVGFMYDALFGMGTGLGFFAAYSGTLVTAAFSAVVAAFRSSIR